MAHEAALTGIENFLNRYISKWPDIFLVDLRMVHGANKITVLLDGDSGINIDKCAEVNRALYKFVEEDNVFNGENFSMEVSSPGIDRPLKLLRQYARNVGRNIEVTKKDMTKVTGKLLKAGESEVCIEREVKQTKKQTEKIEVNIPFSDISQVKVLVTF